MSDRILSVRHPRHGACWLRVVVCTFTESNYRILYKMGHVLATCSNNWDLSWPNLGKFWVRPRSWFFFFQFTNRASVALRRECIGALRASWGTQRTRRKKRSLISEFQWNPRGIFRKGKRHFFPRVFGAWVKFGKCFWLSCHDDLRKRSKTAL